ncbi:DUF86 domain-containing protein [Telluribacter sp. SYSU D00476]|uniref:HepT-like ribonuclease domain-containing protein n=1 Tax=Telluribacter sp. SYSU D00476 TaxID=2811430 RepID=UPI001FF4C9B2|nr:HepT-like ribonuclease domain-containing protein [Telluribacter sp. SYSU D00476]
MREEVHEYLGHILDAIAGIEIHIGEQPSYQQYLASPTMRRAVERELEIIGEAMNRVKKLEPTISISNASHIVYTRNRIIHGYDCIDDTIIWRIVIKDIPVLKEEIKNLLE